MLLWGITPLLAAVKGDTQDATPVAAVAGRVTYGDAGAPKAPASLLELYEAKRQDCQSSSNETERAKRKCCLGLLEWDVM